MFTRFFSACVCIYTCAFVIIWNTQLSVLVNVHSNLYRAVNLLIHFLLPVYFRVSPFCGCRHPDGIYQSASVKRKKKRNMAPAVQETNDESGSVLCWCWRLWFHHATAWTTGTCNNRHRKASPSLSPPSLHSLILSSSEALPGTSSPGSLSAPDENVPGAIDFVSLLSSRPVLQIDYPKDSDDAVRPLVY